jgi:hypothetical protein
VPSFGTTIRDTSSMAMAVIDLQRRLPGQRADELLEGLQSSLAVAHPVPWNDSGHARVPLGREREDAREYVAERLNALGDDWTDHIAIL